MNDHYLVVGASHSGVQVAARLRDRGHEGPITLIGAETHLPYHRPPLSKAYLAGKATVDSLALRPASFYDSKAITLRLGTRIDRLELVAAGAGGRAVTATGEELAFDGLALATGARARRLDVPGADLDGVLYLRDIRDADLLQARITSTRRAVVVGGGFIGLEAAATLRGHGVEVTLLETADRLMGRSVSAETARAFATLHREQGVDVRLGTGLGAIDGAAGKVTAVVLEDGSTVQADLVVVGVGVLPRTELAEGAGLRVDRGVVVDEHARTSHPGVVAAGDATVLPHPLEQGTSIRLESVQNATDSADVAAATLLGQHARLDAVPWFWSDQYDLKLQMAGAASSYDEVVTRGSTASGRFTVLCYREGRLVAGECVNAGADFVAVRRALAAGTTFPQRQAADESVPLKTLL